MNSAGQLRFLVHAHHKICWWGTGISWEKQVEANVSTQKLTSSFKLSSKPLVSTILFISLLFVQRSLGQPKIRHIHYANHLDANIFSYYANLLHKEYEKTVEELKLGECITAYRRIPVHLDKPDGPMKCNIHFANEVFQFIKNTPYSELLVLTLDITGFFDNLKHSILKHKWQNLLGSHNLPPNHYNVFRNITKFSYIDEIDIFETFKEKIIIQKKPKDGSKPTPIKRKKSRN